MPQTALLWHLNCVITAKIWSMGAVVLFACAFSLIIVVQGVLGVPIVDQFRCSWWARRSISSLRPR